MSTALQRVQEHFERVEQGQRSAVGFPAELISDVKELRFYASEMRRLGFQDVKLSPYLENVLLGKR